MHMRACTSRWESQRQELKAHLQALCYAVSELVRRLQLLPVFMHDKCPQALQLHVIKTHVSPCKCLCCATGSSPFAEQAIQGDVAHGEDKMCVDQT